MSVTPVLDTVSNLEKQVENLQGLLKNANSRIEQQRQKFIDDVMDYHEGCESGRREFLKYAGLISVEPYTFQVTFEVSSEEISEDELEAVEEAIQELVSEISIDRNSEDGERTLISSYPEYIQVSY